jgi:hypothetical protein
MAFEGILNIVRRHLAKAVGPHDVRLQLEAHIGVIEHLDGLRGVQLPGPLGPGLEVDQPVENRLHDVLVRRCGGVDRVDVLDVGIAACPQRRGSLR